MKESGSTLWEDSIFSRVEKQSIWLGSWVRNALRHFITLEIKQQKSKRSNPIRYTYPLHGSIKSRLFQDRFFRVRKLSLSKATNSFHLLPLANFQGYILVLRDAPNALHNAWNVITNVKKELIPLGCKPCDLEERLSSNVKALRVRIG